MCALIEVNSSKTEGRGKQIFNGKYSSRTDNPGIVADVGIDSLVSLQEVMEI